MGLGVLDDAIGQAHITIHTSSPWRHETAPCFGPSLWPKAPPPAVRMTFE